MFGFNRLTNILTQLVNLFWAIYITKSMNKSFSPKYNPNTIPNSNQLIANMIIKNKNHSKGIAPVLI